MLARPDVRAALAGRDIGTLFRVLGENGRTQQVLAEVTGMPQSSVSEIVTGRRVIDYRPGNDHRQLALMAHHVATTRV